MKALITVLAACAAVSLAASGAGAATKPMNYDCTKAGNKNKAACKGAGAAPMAAAPAKAAPAPKPAAVAAPAATAENPLKPTFKPVIASKPAPAPMAAVLSKPAPAAMTAAPARPAPAPMAAPGRPAAVAPVVPARAPRAAKAPAAADPNLVEYTTKTGKVIHYDCSKAGNATKTACKK